MIARHNAQTEKDELWARIAAPLPANAIQWRIDGRPVQRDGKHFARFVAYVDAQFVRERLDTVIPGEWDLTLELLPGLLGDGGEVESEERCAFKARLQILGVIREDVGMGRDYKSASSDAFKRVAVRFGIAHELYSYEQNWVQVDSDGKWAKPIEDPGVVYARRQARRAEGEQSARPTNGRNGATASGGTASSAPAPTTTSSSAPPRSRPATPEAADEPGCPKCGGRMWDNRLTKRNPKAPDYKCRDRACDGVIWPPKDGGDQMPSDRARFNDQNRSDEGLDEFVPAALADDDDDLPF